MKRFLTLRMLFSLFQAVWTLFVWVIHRGLCPEISHTYSHHVEGIRDSLPVLTERFAVPVIGGYGHIIRTGPLPAVYYVTWSLLYLTAVLPFILVWLPRDESRARWWWLSSAIGHWLLFIVVAALVTAGLQMPFFLL